MAPVRCYVTDAFINECLRAELGFSALTLLLVAMIGSRLIVASILVSTAVMLRSTLGRTIIMSCPFHKVGNRMGSRLGAAFNA